MAARKVVKQARQKVAKKTGRKVRKKVAKQATSRATSEATNPALQERTSLYDVRFVLPDGHELRFAPTAGHRLGPREFQRLAVQWTYVVRNRSRWAQRADSVDDQAERAQEALAQLGISDADRERLAFAGHVEVVIPWQAESEGWEARIFPWEYVLTAATRDMRRGTSLSVVRRLDAGPGAPLLTAAPRVLYVQSAVGGLDTRYDFGTERRVVEANLGQQPGQMVVLENPTLTQLTQAVQQHDPGIIHLAGFDTHQGLALLGHDDSETQRDGYLLRTDTGAPAPVSAEQLAAALTCGFTPPALVTLNLHNSAGRVAPLLLAAGAGAALAFQDSFDDALAELFLGSFYHALAFVERDYVLAFDLAWAEMRSQPRSVQGSGLVLWSREPLLAAEVTTATPARTAITERMVEERRQVIDLATEPDVDRVVQVTVDPLTEANYSLLHNNRGLFREFAIRKLRPGRLETLRVNAELHVGTETYPYRRTFTLIDAFVDLNALVRVPLTSALARSRHEPVQTSLFVEVLWGPPGRERELYRDTHRIALLPADQWRDDDTDRLWLPSFVLPRDAAVAQVIDRAQRYLMALRDDPAAGFDGYQGVDDAADDPTLGVDLQVQAIWSAILYDYGLSYINPPPAYATVSQRIRTPSEVLTGRRGTCLDLTLLLAACLEYVDIYPVVFLLKGHAFPGYWRSDRAHGAFVDVTAGTPAGAGPDDAIDAQRAVRTPGQRESWYLPATAWPEMITHVRSGALVPLESVWLTAHRGFGEAIDAGYENLEPRAEFDAMLDVLLARGGGVTPLPIEEEQP